MYKTKYDFDDTVFSKLNNKSAYWIGFIMADGYINGNRLQLGISKKDEDVLRQFKDFIKSPDRPIREWDNNGHPAIEVRVRSYGFKKDLERYGMGVKKKDRGRINIDLLQENIRKDFLRGYFDGDGGFYVDTRGYLFAEICGYKPTLKDIKNILVSDKVLNDSKKITKNGKIFRIRFSASDSLRLGRYLYGEYPNIYTLHRKYNLYNSHVERLNNLAGKLSLKRQSTTLKGKELDLRPIKQWNKGKQQEYKERKIYSVDKALNKQFENKKV